jgi:hypothetical protein
MNSIGGYFGLELNEGPYRYHDTPLTFKTGRASLHFMLTLLKPDLVYIPFYTCGRILESFKMAQVKYLFYAIDENLEPVIMPHLNNRELFLYINYMDLKRPFVEKLSKVYGNRLIVDCTQAFFMKGNGSSWFFNSCRKFFGVPDGSYLYAPDNQDPSAPRELNEDYYINHLLKRFNGHAEKGYADYLDNETKTDAALTGMSRLTAYLLSWVDYELVAEMRLSNYQRLHRAFWSFHLLGESEIHDGVPMMYPLLPRIAIDKGKLAIQKLYVPAFWQDVMERTGRGYGWERSLSNRLLPLPIDHRYDTEAMFQIIKQICPLL